MDKNRIVVCLALMIFVMAFVLFNITGVQLLTLAIMCIVIILAAKRAGINTIIISEDNRKDIEDIKEIYVKGLTFVYVKTIEDVIKYIF